jgi:hypothetical protein
MPRNMPAASNDGSASKPKAYPTPQRSNLAFAVSNDPPGAGHKEGTAGKKLKDVMGYTVLTDGSYRLLAGPVVGEVTTSTAIIMMEIEGPDSFFDLECQLYENDTKDKPAFEIKQEVRTKRTFTLQFKDLKPNTRYTAIVNGIQTKDLYTRTATFKTKPEVIKNFRIIVVSCDRPARLLVGQTNPWMQLLKHVQRADVLLHIGDQIYLDSLDVDSSNEMYESSFDKSDDLRRRCMMAQTREVYRRKYREIFSREGKVDVMAKVSNLMIWSDNDVANDFTTMKDPDDRKKQAYHPNLIQSGMMAYREYQRRLWDPNCSPKFDSVIKEWHSHIYGSIGIFFFDLRGNRILGNGVQQSERPLCSDEQWADFDAFMQNPQLRVIILCSETPFVGDPPELAIKKVAEIKEMDMLRDHWPFNKDELIRLMDTCFTWKGAGKKGERELLLVGGDIHCGVTSQITDSKTGLVIDHITTSPITNHVCKFFPERSGSINQRYSYTHEPLGREYRNYCTIDINISDDQVSVKPVLVPVPTDPLREINFDFELDFD